MCLWISHVILVFFIFHQTLKSCFTKWKNKWFMLFYMIFLRNAFGSWVCLCLWVYEILFDLFGISNTEKKQKAHSQNDFLSPTDSHTLALLSIRYVWKRKERVQCGAVYKMEIMTKRELNFCKSVQGIWTNFTAVTRKPNRKKYINK